MSQPQTHIVAIKSLTDNYIWAITSTENNAITLVDPGDANVCIDFIEANNLTLCSILITHHHIDHVGGIDELRAYCDNKAWPLVIYGPKYSLLPNSDALPIPKKYNKHTDNILTEGSTLSLAEFNLTLKVMALPGHTLEHIAYFNDELIFCGDVLFSGGCGRTFEGNAEQMKTSLDRIANLSDSTLIYCTHEYTLSNLNFALTVEPDNVELINYFNKVSRLRENNQITLPTNIALEQKINPFLRVNQQSLAISVSEFYNQDITHSLGVFTALRKWKDIF